MDEIKEGSRVVFAEDQLKYFQAAFAARIANREGVVESIYTQVGMSKNPPPMARVRWLKRANRGKEFIERHQLRNLRPA